ncbi:MAG: rod shape-determining protein MreD [Desulfuromonadales bacterium]|jgi:rod shape-determining protein MreD
MVLFLLVGMFLIVLQTSVLQALPAWFGFPDFVFILVAFVAFRFDWLRGFLLSFAFGWMMDVVSVIYLGIFVVKYLAVFFILKLFTQNSPVKESAYQVPMVGVSYFLVQLGFYASLTMAAAELVSPWSWNRMWMETIILMIATVPCFLIFNSLYEYMHNRRTIPRAIRKRGGNRFR